MNIASEHFVYIHVNNEGLVLFLIYNIHGFCYTSSDMHCLNLLN